MAACAQQPVTVAANDRAFVFPADVFAFSNELTYQYRTDPKAGTTELLQRNPDAHYTLRCFALARSARQFFQFARFAPEQPAVDDAAYGKLVEAVIAHDPSRTAETPRVVIPGYPDLRAFSAAKEALLKDKLGSALDSYLQRGNWRLVFPFSRSGQALAAQNLLAEVRANRPPVVHLVTFPEMTIDHAVLLYAAAPTAGGIRFQVYDPNNAAQPTWLDFDAGSRSFRFPSSNYFAGGAVAAYEVYRSLLY